MKHISFLTILLLPFGLLAQEKSTSTPCQATCTMPDQYETEIVTYYIYTGDEENAPFTEKMTIDLQPSKVVWKKMPDPNCPSGNPGDCMVWTPKETEGETIELTVVTNINQQSRYITEQFSRERQIKEGGYNAPCQVICENDLTASLMYNVSMRLTDLGYYSDLIYSVFNSKIKAALKKYQQHNGLPVGHLNKQTIESLELDWPYAEKEQAQQPEQ